MTNNHEPWHYYVGYEDGEEMVIEYYDFIFEALASYHEAINEGPEEFNLVEVEVGICDCLLYTSPSPRDRTRSRMPSSA